MANTIGEKELKKDYPHESGLTARTQKQKGRKMNLVPTEGSLIARRKKVGI